MKARENPFRTDRVLALRYRPLEGTLDELLARLARLDYRAEIVGAEGSGKTTLLEDVAVRLEERRIPSRWLRPDGRPHHKCELSPTLRSLREEEILLIDGADSLGFLTWRRVVSAARHSRGLVVTTHRRGRLPLLLRCETTPDLLAEFVRRLQPTDRPVQSAVPDAAGGLDGFAQRLFARHRGNLRDALRELYDHYARL